MNIKKKKSLNLWDFPNVQEVEIDSVKRDIPELTEENFWTLIDDYNTLIKLFNDSIDALTKEIKELKSR
jgi:hypothetical protein